MFAAGSWICTSRTGFVVEPKNGIVHGCSDGTTCDSIFGWFLPRETLFNAAQDSWLPKSLTHRQTTLNPRMHSPFFSNPITIPNSLAIRSQHPRKPVRPPIRRDCFVGNVRRECSSGMNHRDGFRCFGRPDRRNTGPRWPALAFTGKRDDVAGFGRPRIKFSLQNAGVLLSLPSPPSFSV